MSSETPRFYGKETELRAEAAEYAAAYVATDTKLSNAFAALAEADAAGRQLTDAECAVVFDTITATLEFLMRD